MTKRHIFLISVNQFHDHHPDREHWPEYTLSLPASLHHVVNAFQRLPATPENYVTLHDFIKSLTMIEIQMDMKLQEEEK